MCAGMGVTWCDLQEAYEEIKEDKRHHKEEKEYEEKEYDN